MNIFPRNEKPEIWLGLLNFVFILRVRYSDDGWWLGLINMRLAEQNLYY